MAELPDKRRDFMDWYLAVVDAAQLTDKRYPIKGMNVWTPYGLRARRLLDAIMIREIEATGSKAIVFATLIPETEFAKEAEHIEGFHGEVFWVTRGGESPLDVPLLLRPTSETAMYPLFAIWVRSHRDLPLNVYQIVNTFRYETKTTRPFLRVREIYFFEEHTCQVDEARATERVRSNLEAFGRMARSLQLPYVAIRRPDWDKFAGAYYSVALDIPIGGARTLQIGSIHHYRENFSRAYGIQYETPSGEARYAHQTTFGLSERLLGAVVAVHGDERGVIFPRALAPFEVVVVPIPTKDGGGGPTHLAEEVAARLAAHHLRVEVDRTDERPGAKYYRWELAGVPLRIEIGRREVERQELSYTDRLGTKGGFPVAQLETEVEQRLEAFDRALFDRALRAFRSAFSLARTLDELSASDRVRVVSWCGREECGHAIEKAIDRSLLGTPEGELPIPLPEPARCIVCGKPRETRWAVVGRQL